MLGTITNQTGNTNHQVFTEIKSLERKIDGLETQVNNIQTEVDSFDNNITTENLNSTNIISQSINTNAISGTSISSETLTSDSIISDNIISDNINADSITTDSITSDEIHGQIKDRQSTITSDTGNITTLDSEDIDVDLLKAKAATITKLTLEDSLNTTDVTATNVNADNITGTNGNITTLQSTTATIDEISNTSITSHTATVDSIDVEEAEIDEANVGTLKSDEVETAVITGKEVINLDPQKITEQDYYLLKIKKEFDSLHLFVEDSLDINIINAYTPNGTTNGTPLVISNCHSVNEIVLYSKDTDYYYIEISPNNTNELHYSYKAHEKIQDLITASLNEEVDFDWYYKTERTSEIIFLGSTDEEDKFNYQFTVLGKLNALVSPTFENYVFDDITVNKNIYTKDFFNEETQDWTYKKGEVNDYLSNIEDYIDEETGEQKTRVDWRKRVAFRNPNQYIVTTEDSTEDVEVEGTKIGERTVKANVNTLIDLGTLRNYNGQWITEPEPTGRMVPPYSIVFEGKEYSDIPDNEWKVLFSDPMDFSTRPELDKTMAAMVKISDYGQNTQEKSTCYKELYGDTDWDIFLTRNRGWTKKTDGSATVYTAPYTTGEAEHYEYTEHVGDINELPVKLTEMDRILGSADVQQAYTDMGFTPTLYSISVVHHIFRYSVVSGEIYAKDDRTGEFKAVKYIYTPYLNPTQVKVSKDLILLDEDGNFIHSVYQEREEGILGSSQTEYYTRDLVSGGSTSPYTTDDGWIQVIYGANDEDSNYVLINKIIVDNDSNFSAYQDDTVINSNISLCIYRENEFRVGGIKVTGTAETAPTTTVNPITKLGVVDEGTWVAGDVTTPNLKVNDSTVLNTTTTINDDLHITEKVLDFGGTNYDVWDYANDNMNWVEE